MRGRWHASSGPAGGASNSEPSGTNAVDTAIVGAGITGLRCAERLAAHGRELVVLEARDRIGGRLWSPSAEAGGPRVDLGATWFWPQEPRITALVRELGLPTHAQHLDGDAVYEDLRGIQRLQGNPIDAPAGRFSIGAQSVAEALASRLPEGAIRTSCPARAVSRDGHRVRVATEGGVVLARHVVLALPPALAATVIDVDPPLPEPLASIALATPVWMGATAKVVVRYSEAFWRGRGLAGAAVSHRGPLREIHDMSGPDGEDAALFGFAPGAPSGATGPEGRVSLSDAAVTSQLVRLFGPEAGNPKSIRVVDWSRERWTTPPRAPVSQRYELYGHPVFQVPVHEAIHFASTETARAFAGHIEGSLLAAEETVRRIVGADSG